MNIYHHLCAKNDKNEKCFQGLKNILNSYMMRKQHTLDDVLTPILKYLCTEG